MVDIITFAVMLIKLLNISKFRKILTINNDYSPKQHYNFVTETHCFL
jgi:hypothetical protein